MKTKSEIYEDSLVLGETVIHWNWLEKQMFSAEMVEYFNDGAKVADKEL